MNWIDINEFQPPEFMTVLMLIRSLKDPTLTYITTGYITIDADNENDCFDIEYNLSCFDDPKYNGARHYTPDPDCWEITYWSLQPGLPKEFQAKLDKDMKKKVNSLMQFIPEKLGGLNKGKNKEFQ